MFFGEWSYFWNVHHQTHLMNKLPLLLAAAACSTLPLVTTRAQEPSPAPAAIPSVAATPAPSISPAESPAANAGTGTDKLNKRGAKVKGALRGLPLEERKKLRQARDAAQADPAVQAAKASGDKRAAAKATREAMVRSDPSVAPIMDKVRTEARENKQPGAPGVGGKGERGGKMERQLARLSADERAKLTSARQAAQSDPKVAALQKEWKSAATPEVKTRAGEAYRQGLRDAILRNDPSLAPILQKIQGGRKAAVESDAL